jgi:copper chaperone
MTDPATAITFSVPGVSCAHCERAIDQEVSAVPGVESVAVDLGAKRVEVRGSDLDEAALVAAIDEAGYDAEPV